MDRLERFYAVVAYLEDVDRAFNREEEPSTAIPDSPSINTSPVRGIEHGFDAGKNNLGTQTASLG